MKHLLRRFSTFLAIALLGLPLAWAVSFSGLSIKAVPQLSFDTRSLQADAPSPDVLTRDIAAGAYTLKALSPYSKGAITYRSSAPDVATVDASSGLVTPKLAGQPVIITANQAAQAPFPAATARYTLTLTGIQVTYGEWKLENRTFGSGSFDLSLSAPKPSVSHPSPIEYSTTTPDVVEITDKQRGTVALRKVGTATVVARQAASGNFSAGYTQASFEVLPATPTLSWVSSLQLRLGDAPLTLTPPASDNTDPAATFRFTVGDGRLAEVNNGQLVARLAGTTTVTAHQAKAGNHEAASITVPLVVQPAQVGIGGITPGHIEHTLGVDTATNVIKLEPTLVPPPGVTLPAGTVPVFTYSLAHAAPADLATLDGNRLTLVKAGEAVIIVTLQRDAGGQYEEATRQIPLKVLAVPLTPVAYEKWTLEDRVYGAGTFDLNQSPPKPLVPTSAAFEYSTTTPDVVEITDPQKGTVRIIKVGTATVVAKQAASDIHAAGETQASFQVLAATPTLSWEPVTLRLGGGALELAPPGSDNHDPAATFSYTVRDTNLATVNGSQLSARRAGTTTITAHQAKAGNHEAASVEVALEVLPARFTITGIGDIDHTLASPPSNNVITLQPALSPLPGIGMPTAPVFRYGFKTATGIATLGNNQLTITKAGSAVIVVSLEKDADNQYEATTREIQLTVVDAPSAPTVFPQITATFGDAPFTPQVSSANPGPRRFSIEPGDVAVVNSIGQIQILNAGNTQVKLHIDATGTHPAVDATAPLVVKALTPRLTMALTPGRVGDAPFTPAVTSDPDVAFATRTFSIVETNGTAASIVGNQVLAQHPGTVTVKVTQAASGNFAEASTTAPFAVTGAAPTLSIRMEDRVFNGVETGIEPVVATNSPGKRRYTSSKPDVVAVDPDTGILTVKGAGENIGITVDVAASASPAFEPASASTTFTVHKRAPQLGIAGDVRAFSPSGVPLAIRSLSGGNVSVTLDKSADVATVSGSGLNWTLTPKVADRIKVSVTQEADPNHLGASAEAVVEFLPSLQASIQWAPPRQWVYSPAGGPANSFTLPQPQSNNKTGQFRYELINEGGAHVATLNGNVVSILSAPGNVTLKAIQAGADGFADTAATSSLQVLSQQSSVTLGGTQPLTELRYRDAPVTLSSAPPSGGGVDRSSWSVSYVSDAPAVLAVNGTSANAVFPGDANVKATWRSPDGLQSVVVNHPFRVLKALPGTQFNFVSPLLRPFKLGEIFTPPIQTSSDAAVQLRSENLDVATVFDGASLRMNMPGQVRIHVTQAASDTYEGFSADFLLELQLGTLVVSGFPARTHTLDPLDNVKDLIPPAQSDSPMPFKYTSSNLAVAEVVAGKLVLKAPGWTDITAGQDASPPHSATSITARYTVLAADPQLAFDPGIADTILVGQPVFVAARSRHGLKPVTYASGDLSLATVNASDGLVTGTQPGTVTIVATQEAVDIYRMGSATRTLMVRKPAGLRLEPMAARVGGPDIVPPWQTDSQGAVTVTVTPNQGTGVVSQQGNTLKPTGVGSVWVELSQAATGTHTTGTARALLTVSASVPTITTASGGGLPAIYSKTYPPSQTFDLPPLKSTNTSAPLVFGSSNENVASVAAKGDGSATVTVKAEGQADLIVSQPAGNGWDAVSHRIPLIVSANGQGGPLPLVARDLPFGSPDFLLAATLDGVSGSITRYTSSNTLVAEVLDDFTVSIRDVGETAIQAWQGGQVVGEGLLRVVPADQSLNFADQTLSLLSFPGGTPPTLALHATASSGEAIDFEITGGDTDAVHLGKDGRTLWLLWDPLAGRMQDARVSVRATQAGNARYKPVSVTRTITVQRDTDTAPAWHQLVQGLPDTVPSSPGAGGLTHQAILRHNMSPRRELRITLRAAAGSTMRCRVAGIQRGASPEEPTLITAVFEGGTGRCNLVMFSDDADLSSPTTLDTVASATLDEPVPPSTTPWPLIALPYRGDVPDHYYTPSRCADPQDPLFGTCTADVGTPVASFLFDNDTQVTAEPAGVVALSPDPVNNRQGHVLQGNNPPRVVGLKVGAATLKGRAGGKWVSTTVNVIAAQPTVVGWDSPIAMTLPNPGEPFRAPLSTSPGPMSFRVSPPELARVESGGDGHRIVPLRAGDGFVVMEQLATGNHAGITLSRPLWVTEPPPAVNFGTVSKVYGEPAFTMQLPAEIVPGQPVTIGMSTSGVMQVSADTTSRLLNIDIVAAGSTSIDLLQGSVKKATATIHVNKAVPSVNFTVLSPFTVEQPSCGNDGTARFTVPVHFPLLNQGVFTAQVNGERTFLNASLSSSSNGAVTYRILNSPLLSFGNGGNVGQLVKPRDPSEMATRAGVPVDLEIQQAETANHLGRTLRVPGAIRIISPDYQPRPYTAPSGTVFPDGLPDCPA